MNRLANLVFFANRFFKICILLAFEPIFANGKPKVLSPLAFGFVFANRQQINIETTVDFLKPVAVHSLFTWKVCTFFGIHAHFPCEIAGRKAKKPESVHNHNENAHFPEKLPCWPMDYARSFFTRVEITRPSARPARRFVATPMTLPMSDGLLAPTSAMMALSCSSISASESCFGR